MKTLQYSETGNKKLLEYNQLEGIVVVKSNESLFENTEGHLRCTTTSKTFVIYEEKKNTIKNN